MSEFVVRVEHLGKKYQIWHQGQRPPYVALRDVISGGVASAARSIVDRVWRRRGRTRARGSVDDFWALKDVTFDVKVGEVLGIIGSNGAGKSTLLKILSRVTEPTEGRVRLRGRVASLLEVGTGFHPELTGRENIQLNGSILGMTRREIRRRFDEIVDFAEVEAFLDTPVKRYSSGMYVRLAFAVAAHLEPEILIVDEVLAVGDAEFQAKCLGKMREVSRSHGRTVLFVSHNMGAVQSLCSRGIVLSSGAVAFDGHVQEAVGRYLQQGKTPTAVTDLRGRPRKEGTGEARIISIRLENRHAEQQTHFVMGDTLNVIIRVHFSRAIKNPTFGVKIATDSGIRVADCLSSHYGLRVNPAIGAFDIRVSIESLLLYPRTYIVEPWIADTGCLGYFDIVRNAATFVVTSGPGFMNGASVFSYQGISFIPTRWKAVPYRDRQDDSIALELQSHG
jgi:lipopolysaccharide transport system ATP-binding protein